LGIIIFTLAVIVFAISAGFNLKAALRRA